MRLGRLRIPRPWLRRVVVVVGVLTLAVCNLPLLAYAQQLVNDFVVNRDSYKAEYGHWDTVAVPSGLQVNAIHAALLSTGKVLIVAGSGNNQKNFDSGTFKTLLWDPANGSFTMVPTPADLFCAGHAFLPNGDLLIAGGTKRYEVLQDKVTRAAGAMTVRNESPDKPGILKKDTRFVSPAGIVLHTTEDTTVPPATKTVGPDGRVSVRASSSPVWVEADRDGPASVITAPAQYRIDGLTGPDSQNLYGTGEKFTLEKQDFQGLTRTYVFNVREERYERVGDMGVGRWYPTLATLPDGRILAASGLDQFGAVLDGTTEIYDPAKREWTTRPDLQHYFPTYPALFLMANSPGKLFYSGSNAGYGPEKKGREPGIWDLATNTFTPVPGLRDPDQLETSSSLLLAPAQDQKVMVIGGGGVGESNKSTARTDIIDLTEAQPHFTPGPDLPEGTRYPSSVLLPDDNVLVTGGSRDYRGKGASDNHNAGIYHPGPGTFTEAASPTVGRDYHSEALLLPDGRVVTLGSDPLFADQKNTVPGTFEQRIEVYSPPYLYRGARPSIVDGPGMVQRGSTAKYQTPNSDAIVSARLVRPSAVTHVTDIEQRSIALTVKPTDGAVELAVPSDPSLVPDGWYMLFVTNPDGIPSVARWVHVGADHPSGCAAGSGHCCCSMGA